MLPISVFLIVMVVPVIILMPLIVVVCKTYFCGSLSYGYAYHGSASTSRSVQLPISVILTVMAMPVVFMPLIILVCQFLFF